MMADTDKRLEKAREQQQRAIERAKSKGQPALTRSKPVKSKGMAGKSRTKADLSLHDKLGQLGCICCINAGLVEPFSGSPVSIHHIRGRTIPDAHKFVLPLCAWHHDTPVPADAQVNGDVFPIHAKGSEGGKVKWESVNGPQMQLWQQAMEMIGVLEPKSNRECKMSRHINPQFGMMF